MLVKVVLSCEPSVLTTVMMTTEMPAAIRPYSMAVAPDSSLAKILHEIDHYRLLLHACLRWIPSPMLLVADQLEPDATLGGGTLPMR
jgi:hypothetical protein